jgi:hypothetical protein
LQGGTGNSNVNFLTVSGGVSSNLIPSANVTFDLGTASQRWKDLYLSGNSIFIGDAAISYDGTTFKVVVGSDEIFTADDSGASVVESTTANTITANSITSNTITVNTATILAGLSVTGTTIHQGNVEINGSIIATGNIITLDVEQFRVNDPILLLANNNVANTFDIGFTGHYGSQQLHTGLIRHAVDEKYYLFQGYEDHFLANNSIDPSDPSFELSNLVIGNLEANVINSGVWQGTIIGSTYGGTGVNNGANTLTMQGNVTFSGQHNVTLTATGTTSVTLPTSGSIASTGKAIAMAIVFG